MPGTFNPAARALGLLVVIAAVAHAQAPKKECSVDENNPQSIAKASFMVQRAQSAPNPGFAAGQLAPAVKSLTDVNAASMPNQAGRNLVLGRALTLWTMQPNAQMVTTRGSLGYATDPQGTIDLVAAIDSAFSFVEKSNPDCIGETSRWRRSPAWVAMANDAVRLMNSNTDSAAFIARRAVQLNPFAPYAYMVLAYSARQSDSTSAALAYYRKASESVQYDTSFAEVGAQSLSLLAEAALDAADAIDTTANASAAATRRDYLSQAQAALQQLSKDPKYANEYAASTRAGLCRVAVASGDTASLRRDYAAMLANPSTLTFAQDVDAGVCMSRASMYPEAVVFFHAANSLNPYHRNSLGNLARVLLETDKPWEALPYSERALKLEPNDQENITLLAQNFAAIVKAAQNTLKAARPAPGARTGAKTTAGARPAVTLTAAQTDSLNRIVKVYTDSALAFNQQRIDLKYKVELSNFTVDSTSATLGGSVLNQGDATTPITLHVDFLDNTGKVIASKDETLSPAPHGRARFSVKATPSTGVTAFSYTIK